METHSTSARAFESLAEQPRVDSKGSSSPGAGGPEAGALSVWGICLQGLLDHAFRPEAHTHVQVMRTPTYTVPQMVDVHPMPDMVYVGVISGHLDMYAFLDLEAGQ